MSPVVGVSSPNSNRMNVDLPDPDGPIRKTNSPLSILSETLSRAGRAEDLYSLLTWSRVIITAPQWCAGAGGGVPQRRRGPRPVGHGPRRGGGGGRRGGRGRWGGRGGRADRRRR